MHNVVPGPIASESRCGATPPINRMLPPASTNARRCAALQATYQI